MTAQSVETYPEDEIMREPPLPLIPPTPPTEEAISLWTPADELPPLNESVMLGTARKMAREAACKLAAEHGAMTDGLYDIGILVTEALGNLRNGRKLTGLFVDFSAAERSVPGNTKQRSIGAVVVCVTDNQPRWIRDLDRLNPNYCAGADAARTAASTGGTPEDGDFDDSVLGGFALQEAGNGMDIIREISPGAAYCLERDEAGNVTGKTVVMPVQVYAPPGPAVSAVPTQGGQ